MLGEREATVTDVKPFDLHGVTFFDLALVLPDGSTHTARLGPEGVPAELKAGERVLAMFAANMVVSLRRP